jgi:hypothetical protein
MAATKSPIAPDSAEELHDLIGDDATATFESDPKFIDSDPTDTASSENVEVQRGTDDIEDSEDEEEEEGDEDDENELEDEDVESDEELEDEEEEYEDDNEEDEDEEDDDEDEVGALGVSASDAFEKGSSLEGLSSSEESALEEDDDAGDEGEMVDEYVIEGGSEEESGEDSPETDRVIDAALRMRTIVTATELAARVYSSEV